MSAEMASAINVPVVYVPLLNEGTPVVRPTQGVQLEGNVY
jgi:hypothetical protein